MSVSGASDAPTVSAFMAIALSGSTTESVISHRTTNVSSASAPIASGRCDPIASCWSTKVAAGPVTSAVNGAGVARIASTTRWAVAPAGSPETAAFSCQVSAPSQCGGVTRVTPARRATWAAKAPTAGACERGARIATVTGDWPAPAKSRASASATTRALWPCGITALSLAGDQETPSAGTTAASITAAVTAATNPGRRITSRANRYQRSPWPARASGRASAAPHSPSSAGDTVSALSAAITAVIAPAIPIDFRKPWGNSISVISAQATVAAEKSTLRPARASVRPIAARGSAPAASSSRYRVTMNSV